MTEEEKPLDGVNHAPPTGGNPAPEEERIPVLQEVVVPGLDQAGAARAQNEAAASVPDPETLLADPRVARLMENVADEVLTELAPRITEALEEAVTDALRRGLDGVTDDIRARILGRLERLIPDLLAAPRRDPPGAEDAEP